VLNKQGNIDLHDMTMVMPLQKQLDKAGYTSHLHTTLMSYRLQAQAAAAANPPPPRPPPPRLDFETLPTWGNSLICKVQWQGRTLEVSQDEATQNWVQPIGGTRWWNIDAGCWHIHSPEDEAALKTELRLHKVARVQFRSLAEAELPSSSGASSSQHRHRPAAAFPDHDATDYGGAAPPTPEDGALYSGRPPTPALLDPGAYGWQAQALARANPPPLELSRVDLETDALEWSEMLCSHLDEFGP
jgi:hypothetical protein